MYEQANDLYLFYLTDFTAEVNGGGPLLEYERRIAAGELVDGDECQVCLLFLVIISLLLCFSFEILCRFQRFDILMCVNICIQLQLCGVMCSS